MSDRRSTVVLLSISILLVAVIGSGPVSGQAENASTHTLEITSKNGSATYAATSSSSLQLKNSEPSDHSVQKKQVAGTVGGSGDQKDVIHYTGHIRSFESEGVKVRLDGKRVSPDVLSGNHIQITHPTNASGKSVKYHFPVKNGTAEHGELAEKNDTANKTTIQGSINSGADSFYFTGNIPDKALNGSAKVRINGHPANKFKNPPPTPPTTTTTASTMTTVPATTSPSPTSTTNSTTATVETSGTNVPQQDSQSGSNTSNTFLIGFIAGILLLIGGGIAGLFLLDR